MPRRQSLLLVVVLLGAASMAAADDAQQAAAAAAAAQGGGGYQMPAGVAQAVAGAAQQGAPGAAGGAAGAAAKPGSGGGFQRALSAPVIPKAGDRKPDGSGRHGVKGKSPKRKIRVPESKYKSRDLIENSEHNYRFDSQGNPIHPGVKKRAVQPSKASSAESEDAGEEPSSCSDGRSCAGKGSDADAL